MTTRRNLFTSLGFSSLVLLAALGCDDTPLRQDVCREGQVSQNGACVTLYDVRVNSIGFLTNRKKYASWTGKGTAFEIKRVKDDSVAKKGKAAGPVDSPDTQEKVYVAEFGDLGEGEYYVDVSGVGRSPSFKVATDALGGAFDMTMLGFYGQRCGVEVEIEEGDNTFHHDACHEAKASLERVGGGEKDDTGGWHDAGDYGKYVVNGAFAVGLLLHAYEHGGEWVRGRELAIPEGGNALPDVLDEAKVELDWILKTQFEDGSFAHKVTARSFEGEVMPEYDTQQRYFTSAGSAATGDAVAVLALAGRLFRDFDADYADKCLDAARAGQAFLDEHPDQVVPDLSGITTGGYGDGNDADERFWALVELWETTGEVDYLIGAEEFASSLAVRSEFDWPHVGNLGFGTYIRSVREGRDQDVLFAAADGAVAIGDQISEAALSNPYGRGTASYYWGANGVVARLGYNLMLADFVAPSSKYRDAAHRQLDHLFGNNYYGRSFVTGLGANPAQNPHHRPSQSDSVFVPWPGLLVGGPSDTEYPSGDRSSTPALTWQDVAGDYWHNEIAINWNAALAYTLAVLNAAESAGCEECLVPGPNDGLGGAAGN